MAKNNKSIKSQTGIKRSILLSFTVISLSIFLIMAMWYNVNDIPSFELTYPSNSSTVPNHWTNLNVSVNETGNLDIKIFANSNSSRLNLQDSLVFHTLNASENISYRLTTIPIQHDDDGLVALYHFDNRSEFGENDTFVYDFSGNGNNGTVVGATWNETGKMGGAMQFDGVNDYISIPNSASITLTKNITMSVWINPSILDNNLHYILDKYYNRYALSIYSDDISVKYKNDTGDSNSVSASNYLSINEWFFVTATINIDGDVSIYIDGVLANAKSFVGNSIQITAQPLTIGVQENTNYFNGSIDDVAIYNRTLNSSEIEDLYELQIEKYYWKVNATDTSGNSNESDVWEFTPVNPTIEVNFSSSIGDIRNEAVVHTGLAPRDPFGSTQSCIWDTVGNYTLERQAFSNSGMKLIKLDSHLYYNANEDKTFSSSGKDTNITSKKQVVNWAYQNGLKVMFTITGTPEWLGNKTTGYCNTSTSTNSSCPPSNYTRWGELVIDFANITDCSIYQDTCIFEIGNEMYGGGWLNNLSYDNITKGTEFVKLYNASYIALKDTYPNIRVGGAGFFYQAPLITQTFLSNMTTNMDFVSIHSYYYSTDFLNRVNTDVNNLRLNCSTYGANCSWIIISEWNSEITDGLAFTNYHSMGTGTQYINLLNNGANNLSSIIYKFNTQYTNHSCDSNYNYSIFSQAEPLYQLP